MLVTAAIIAVLQVQPSFSQEPTERVSAARTKEVDPVDRAVSRGLTIVQKGAANYPSHRECFSCHHQTLPMLAMVTARGRGLSIDEKLLHAQAEFSHRTFKNKIDDLKEGRGVGGAAMTVGYGLLTLRLVDWKPDETTEAIVAHLLKTQHVEGHWGREATRPPLEESDAACTVLAVHGMRRYSTAAQRGEVDAALARAKTWLASAAMQRQEDKVARLWGVQVLGGSPEELRAARETVLAAQQSDGGWAQDEDLASDAYATGQTLFVLHETGLAASEPAHKRGVQFLLTTQAADGSWLVETRSKPIQVFFDNGDPHGKSQFISMAATSWATAALASSGPDAKRGERPAERAMSHRLRMRGFQCMRTAGNGSNLSCF